MRTLFYFRTHFDDAANQGVVKKCKAIAAQGDILYFTTDGLCFNNTVLRPWVMPKQGWRHIWAYYIIFDRFLAQKIDFRNYDVFYIRHLPTHPFLVRLLRVAQQQNPALSIVVELPTWPYDAESKSFTGKIAAVLDRHYRLKMAEYVRFFVHFGLEKTVLGRPTLCLNNGIDVAEIPQKKSVAAFHPSSMQLLAVGSWSNWHGLDRLIEGIAQSKNSLPEVLISLDIVGEGPALLAWKVLVENLGLSSCIRFFPPCTGAELDVFFEKADIAIGSLGLHRIGLNTASPLKHREYCARGIPFVFSGNDGDFSDEFPFALQFPPDDSALSISLMVDFFQKMALQKEVSASMRAYALAHLDWAQKMEAVKKYTEKLG